MPKNNKGELLLKLLGMIEPRGKGFWEGGSEGRVTHIGDRTMPLKRRGAIGEVEVELHIRDLMPNPPCWQLLISFCFCFFNPFIIDFTFSFGPR